jgi:alginate O-acetyltransferase complex protein AlgI
MVFNSITYFIFIGIVFFLYWFAFRDKLKAQNVLLLIASYVFYGWWDWRFMSLMIFSSFIDYFAGIKIFEAQEESKRKFYMWTSVVCNLGLLGYFKYTNFFIESWQVMCAKLGIHTDIHTLQIILPVGISFYTFQTMSYTIDIYRRKMEPTRDGIVFFAFISFFPQLVAGPIERATNLLPQFLKKREFNHLEAKDGLRQILYGLVKKVVIADGLGVQVDKVFSQHDFSTTSGPVLALSLLFFAFQIYCDFSGYSDVAIGSARLFGFRLMRNFAFPFFSRDTAEFWQRWHTSLSSWVRDYIYFPLGGRSLSKIKRIKAVILSYTIIGFWHGPSWNFIIWGFLQGLYFLTILFIPKTIKYNKIVAIDSVFPSISELLRMIATFSLFALSGVFFRTANMGEAIQLCSFLPKNFNLHELFTSIKLMHFECTLIAGLLIFEWIQRRKEHVLQIENLPTWQRWSIYAGAVFLFFYFGTFNTFQQYIYFQF